MNKNTMIVLALVLIILAGAAGFFGGMQYQKSQRAQLSGRFGGVAGGQGFAGRFGGTNGANFAPVRGEVLSIDNNSITVKQMDGTTKIVVVSSNTSFVQSQKATETNLKTGDNVMIVGTTNSDGSVTASNVSINPQQLRPSPMPTQGK